ncbi:MAG: hypothetical protein K5672_00715 [Bacteroidaceae bacterium]|nr:hypothetical protein [Bacteroidaceae bacterium]
MKKIYNSPEVVVVSLQANRAVLQAQSFNMWDDPEIDDPNEILSRENIVISGKNIWDEGW